MSTTTAPAEIPVPRDLLPVLRKSVERALQYLALANRPGCVVTHEELERFCADVERVGAAWRAFALDADAYPAAAVAIAVKEAIEYAESCIADDQLSVDEAEMYVKRVRACEKLLEMTA